MHPKYPNVFRPIQLGPVELPNRFYMSPHAVPMTIAGKPSDDYIHYNVARIKGGCSLIVLSMTVHGRAAIFQPSPHPPENVAAMRALNDAIHAAGGKIFGELYYQWGAVGLWQPLTPPAPAFGASPSQFRNHEKGYGTREMSIAEIGMMHAALRQSIEHMREAQFDGVMIHASHGALAEQFLSPYFNRRTDEYGGDLENRMRFLTEMLEVARDASGPAMAVGLRLNCDELLHGGLGSEDASAILKKIVETGLIDFVDLDIAVEPQQFYIGMPSVFMKRHLYRPYVEAVRGAAGAIPVMSVLGRMTSVADAEAMIAAGVCDMVGAARGLIAEPDLVRNAFEGREEESRTCIACNWCMAGVYDGSAGCSINPASYRERIWGPESLVPASRRAKVIVVGGGPGGLEAARVSALRGHDVTLIEAQDSLGGAFATWSAMPGREDYRSALDWWERQVRKLGVAIRLGTTATAAAILAEAPDAVILATGARYSREGRGAFRDYPVPGHDRDFVHEPDAFLSRPELHRGKVLVLDDEGMQTGMAIAEMLAGKGADVEYLTPNFMPLNTRIMAAQEGRPMVQRLRAAGGRISTMSFISEIGDHEVVIEDVHSPERRVVRDVDAVVFTTSRESRNALEKELDGKVAQLFPVGDALSPRMWATSTFEAHKFARWIGEPGAPSSPGEAYFRETDPWLAPIAGDLER